MWRKWGWWGGMKRGSPQFRLGGEDLWSETWMATRSKMKVWGGMLQAEFWRIKTGALRMKKACHSRATEKVKWLERGRWRGEWQRWFREAGSLQTMWGFKSHSERFEFYSKSNGRAACRVSGIFKKYTGWYVVNDEDRRELEWWI